MVFDLSAVLGQAQQVTDQSNSNSEGKKFPTIVYPGMGTLKVKLLYNPKSNLVSRMIRRHKVKDTNYTCLKTYGQDCPICKMVENINNSLGTDLWQFNDKTRGLSYAQYVGSDGYTWDNGEPEVGELILLMYPWQVYQDINRIISSAGVNASELIAKNEGKILNIIHSKVNGRHEYKAEVEAFGMPFKSCESEEAFESYLNNIPDLSEAITPREINQDLTKTANDVAESLSREYLRGVQGAMSGGFNGNTISQNNQVVEINGQQYVNVNGQYVPVNNNPTPVVTPQSQDFSQFMNAPQVTPVQESNVANVSNASPMPECFGNHKDNDPKCMVCIHEINCIAKA